MSKASSRTWVAVETGKKLLASSSWYAAEGQTRQRSESRDEQGNNAELGCTNSSWDR